MTEEQQLIYNSIDDLPTLVPDWGKKLPEFYNCLNKDWFQSNLPALSDVFVCEFCDMPNETAGIFIDTNRAAKLSKPEVAVRPGIRINSKLQCLGDHVKIALLHEMIHASGIQGHLDNFDKAISNLFQARAYTGLL
jgi:hypothetical protein